MDRSPQVGDGSPGRLIATMVGIVGILLLGSLAWSAVGALFAAVGEATGSLAGARPTPVRLTAVAVTPAVTTTPRPVVLEPTQQATSAPTAQPTLAPPAAPTITPLPQSPPSPTPAPAEGRAPWILLPQPAPGGKVQAGQMTIEARGRGDAPIRAMRLELDGTPLPASLEQRSDAIWRVSATTRISAGQHNVRATITDDQGRTGGYRWTFEAGP